MFGRRSIFAISLVVVVFAVLAGATASVAAPGNLRVLVVANDPEEIEEFPPVLATEPGVATVEMFNSSEGTPSPASLATYDLVVGTGDSVYQDPDLWGNELADYLDAGGAEIQFAYDNWEEPEGHPKGRFESGGYPPFIPGPNENFTSSLGFILVPGSPLLAGVPTFTTSDNTTPALAPGATLLADWANGKPAIATKGRVVSVSASLDDGHFNPIAAAAKLAVNAGNVLGRHTLTVSGAGTGSGTITSTPSGIDCGATCAFNFGNGTAVALTATPSSGSSFAGWSGAGCSGTSSCTVTMDAAQAVTASFALSVPGRTKITKAKINRKKHVASFRFTASGTVTGFECALVKPKKGRHHKKSKAAFRPCSSPKAYKHLKHGSYMFKVRGDNSAGYDPVPAVKKFHI